MTNNREFWVVLLSGSGFVDATYLLYTHYTHGVVPCSVFDGCNTVLTSEYALIFGIPIALFGAVYYATLFFASFMYNKTRQFLLLRVMTTLVATGLASSLYLVYLQIFVLHSLCTYCMASAIITFVLFAFIIKLRLKAQRRSV